MLGSFSLPPPSLCETLPSPWRYASLKIKKKKPIILGSRGHELKSTMTQWVPRSQDKLQSGRASLGLRERQENQNRGSRSLLDCPLPISINQLQRVNSLLRMMTESLHRPSTGWTEKPWWETKSCQNVHLICLKALSRGSKRKNLCAFLAVGAALATWDSDTHELKTFLGKLGQPKSRLCTNTNFSD